MFSLDLQPDEKLFKIYRQTEWALAKTVLIIFILIYVPVFFLLKYELLGDFKWLVLIWTLGVFLYGLNQYLLWLVNSYVITDKRLIAIAYQSMFKKQVLECPLERILNISYSTTGFFSSLLNYGNIEVQVTGLTQPMLLRRLRRPANLKDFLWTLHKQHALSEKPKT